MAEIDQAGKDNSPTAITRAAFAAYRAGDQSAAEPLYAADFAFISPQDDHLDRAAFFQRCFPTAERFPGQRLLGVCALDDQRVLAYYEYELEGGAVFRNVEAITVRQGQIHEVQVFFGGEQALTGTSRDHAGWDVGRPVDQDVELVLAACRADDLSPSRKNRHEQRSRPIAHRRGQEILVLDQASAARADGTPPAATAAEVFTVVGGLVTRLPADPDPGDADPGGLDPADGAD